MVEFDDKGQVYWDFILANCTDDFIKAVEQDLSILEHEREIISVKETDYTITVLIRSESFYIIHEFYRKSENGLFNRDFISFATLNFLREVEEI